MTEIVRDGIGHSVESVHAKLRKLVRSAADGAVCG
jgi:hypothetical protein